MSEKMSAGGKLALNLITFIIRTPLDAWAIWLLWGWFIVPLGAPPLGAIHALGIKSFVMLFAIFGATSAGAVREEYRLQNEEYFGLAKAVVGLMGVGMAWVIHTAMVAFG